MMIVIKVILKKKKIVLERNLLCAKYSGNYCKLYKQASILHINDNDRDKICINDDCRQIILELLNITVMCLITLYIILHY